MKYLRESTSQSIKIGPFVDNTDGYTAETGLTIANTNILLSKSGGAYASKNSGGATYDTNGWYTATLDATDTNTIGNLDIDVNMSGALPVWSSYRVIATEIYDALFASDADGFDANGRTNVGRWLGTAVTTGTTSGKPQVDAYAISNDVTAANNLELMYDGNGYTADTAPAARSQVDGITGSSGGTLNFANEGDNTLSAIKSVTFLGAEDTGDNTSVNASDGSYHIITDDGANNIDIVYQFDVGGGRTASGLLFTGYLTSSNDTANIRVYNGSGWDTIYVLGGQNGSIPINESIPLLSTHTGTGSDLGKVFIRITVSSGSVPILNTDRLLVQAVNIGQSAGYSGGFIYYDSDASNTNTEAFVDGTADNPVSSWSAVKTLAASTGLKKVDVIGSLTLDASAEGLVLIYGHRSTLALGGQNIGDVEFVNFKNVTGTGSTSSARPIFRDCIIGAGSVATLVASGIFHCEIGDAGIVAAGAGYWDIDDCSSGVEGTGSPIINFNSTNNNFIGITNWARGITISGLAANDVVTANGVFNRITLNGAGGTVNISGQYGTLVNNLTNKSGVSAINAFAAAGATGYFGSVWVDEVGGASSGTTAGDDATFRNQANDFDNAQDVADALGIHVINIAAGNSITLSDSLQGYTVNNVQCTLNGGSQQIDSTRINGGFVAGTFARAGTGVPTFYTCQLNNVTSDRVAILNCGIVGTLTLNEAGLYPIVDSQAAGANGTTTIDFNNLSGSTVNMERWSGNLTINNMRSGDTLNLHATCAGDVILNGQDSVVKMTGGVGSITNNLSGTYSLTNNSAALYSRTLPSGEYARQSTLTAGVTLANNAITSSKIANDAITSSKVADGFLTQNKFETDTLSAQEFIGTLPTNLSIGNIVSGNILSSGDFAQSAIDYIQYGLATYNQVDNIATGTAPSAAAIRAEIDSNSTQLASLITKTLPSGEYARQSTLTNLQNSVGNLPTSIQVGNIISGNIIGSGNLAQSAINYIQYGLATESGLNNIATGTAPSAATIRAEIDANSTQLAALILKTLPSGEYSRQSSSTYYFGTLDTKLNTVQSDLDTIVGSDGVYLDSATTDVYHADIEVHIDGDNTQDEYTVTWFKNGQRLSSGITSPTIQVVKRSDGTDLIASTAMTQIGSTGAYKYDASTRLTNGEAALVIVAATISGGSRSFAKVVGRDS